MDKVFVIIRGLPGSGKSTLAKALKNIYSLSLHVEADDWFTNQITCEYNYVQKEIEKAHTLCKLKAEKAAIDGVPLIIVSNTFVKKWEIEPYLEMAKEHNYNIQVIELKSTFDNVHNVPKEIIHSMKEKWEEITEKDYSYKNVIQV